MNKFIFNATFQKYASLIKEPVERLAFYEQVINYGLYGLEPEEPVLPELWTDVVDVLNLQRIRRENGKKGGRPKSSEGTANVPATKNERYDGKEVTDPSTNVFARFKTQK